MSDPIVCAIHGDNLADWWRHLEHHVDRGVAATRGELTVDGVRQAVEDGDMVLLAVADASSVIAVLVLNITVHQSGKRAIGVAVCAGDQLDEWLGQIVDAVEGVGKDFGCTEVTIIGRGGWKKKLAEYGYGQAYTVLSKEV